MSSFSISLSERNQENWDAERGQPRSRITPQEIDERTSSICCHYIANYVRTINGPRFAMNTVKVCTAAGFAGIGGWVSGDPNVAAIIGVSAIYIGPCLSAFANGASTVWSLDTGINERVDALERRYGDIAGLRRIEELERSIAELQQRYASALPTLEPVSMDENLTASSE